MSYQAALAPALAYHGQRAIRQTLLNQDVCKATPLYRYLTATRLGVTDVAAYFLPAARQQYRGDRRAYRRLLGALLPDELIAD